MCIVDAFCLLVIVGIRLFAGSMGSGDRIGGSPKRAEFAYTAYSTWGWNRFCDNVASGGLCMVVRTRAREHFVQFIRCASIGSYVGSRHKPMGRFPVRRRGNSHGIPSCLCGRGHGCIGLVCLGRYRLNRFVGLGRRTGHRALGCRVDECV